MLDKSILVINTGSSSLKFGLYAEQDGEEAVQFDGLADAIGQKNGTLQLKDSQGRTVRSEQLNFASRHDALAHAAAWLRELAPGRPVAVGHRVVHGGPRLTRHQRITPAVVTELRACVHFAPLHIPMAVQLVEEAERTYPDVPQFACFDTAFHCTMPDIAKRFPLSKQLFEAGIRRYGFHGLSYESIVHELGGSLGRRTVVAHLGSGASVVAINDGRSMDTSMGLTPTGGIPMATRTGDLDPGVLLYLHRAKQMNADSLEQLVNQDAGLKALSGGIADMRELQKAATARNVDAQLAIDAFCLAIAKTVAAYAVVLGGLDMLIFAGGIGEHSSSVRSQVCERLALLGLALDPKQNEVGAARISAANSTAAICVVASQEDLQIARHCRKMMQSK
jgi:acetate kinase